MFKKTYDRYNKFLENKDLKIIITLLKCLLLIFFLALVLFQIVALYALYQDPNYDFFIDPFKIRFLLLLMLLSLLLIKTIYVMIKNIDELKMSVHIIKKIILPFITIILGSIFVVNPTVVYDTLKNASIGSEEMTNAIFFLAFIIILPTILLFILIIFESRLWVSKLKKRSRKEIIEQFNKYN